MNDIADSTDDVYAVEVLARLKPLLEQVPQEVLDELEVQRRLAVAAALSGKPALVRQAIMMLRRQADLVGPVDVSAANSFWQADELKAAGSRRAVEIASFASSELGTVPWFGMKFDHRLQTIKRVAGGRLRLEGKTEDQLGHLDDVPELHWQVRLYERDGLQREWVFAMEARRSEDGRQWMWSAVIELPRTVDFVVLPRMTVRVDLQAGAVRNTSGISITRKHKWASYRRASTGALSRLFGARYQPYKTIQNTLALKPSSVKGKRSTLRKALRPLFSAVRRTEANRWEPIADHNALRVRFVYWLLRRMPLQRNLVLVDAQMGTSNFDSPHAIANAISDHYPKVSVIRAASAGRPVWAAGRSDTVRIGTWKHLMLLARAGSIIDNQSLPSYYTKRRGQIYVQTWHGIPLKRMGLDQAEVAGSKARTADIQRRSAFWDYLSIPSEFFRDVFVPSFAYKNVQLPVGSPRNDELVRCDAEVTRKAKSQLGLDATRQTVLYAPTFRDGRRGPVALELDLDAWVEAMASDFQLLVRPHYLNRISVPRYLRRHIVDVSTIKDTNLVMMAADLLVTDYSSVMFDFLVLDRPQVLYTYDLEKYAGSMRGTYFDLREDAPGPLAMDQQQLMLDIRHALESDSARDQRGAFRRKYAGEEPGNASQTTVETVWGQK